MDSGIALVAALIENGVSGLRKVQSRGIKAEDLTEHGRVGFEIVQQHFKDYGLVPSAATVSELTGQDFETPLESLDFFIDEVIKNKLFTMIRAGIDDIAPKMRQHDPAAALTLLEQLASKARAELDASRDEVVGLGRQSLAVKEIYDRIKHGERGIPLPWPTMMEHTLGLWPGEVMLFVARPGSGKTFTLIICALFAAAAGKKVLFLTTEMDKTAIARRMLSVRMKLPFQAFRGGRLTYFEERGFEAEVQRLGDVDDTNIRLAGGDFKFSLDHLETVVSQEKPDLLVIDGIYLLETPGQSRNERAAAAMDGVKRLANRSKIPIISSTQFNRINKKDDDSTATLDNIGMTDTAGMNFDLIYGVFQSQDMYKDRQLLFVHMKGRDVPPLNVGINWDIERGNFVELPPEETIKISASSVETGPVTKTKKTKEAADREKKVKKNSADGGEKSIPPPPDLELPRQVGGKPATMEEEDVPY
jgi:replicative DNA helicase